MGQHPIGAGWFRALIGSRLEIQGTGDKPQESENHEAILKALMGDATLS
jgi:hypothetical protein